jgi:nucleobase:cation symporter-1, NCS1 family
VPEILIMSLGALVGTFILKIGTGAGGLLPFAHTSAIPSWFVVVFLLFAVVQIFGINSLDMYSSGVTLLALGLKVKRYQAVLIDCAIAFAVTMWAIFSASFTEYLSDFVDIVIIWIAPWCAIFLADWALRRYRYVPSELQKTGRDSLYYRNGGFFWPALVAQLVGMFAAISGLSATFHLPVFLNLVTYHTRDSFGFGGDVSIFLGMGVGAVVYLVLATRAVRTQATAQESLLREEKLLQA